MQAKTKEPDDSHDPLGQKLKALLLRKPLEALGHLTLGSWGSVIGFLFALLAGSFALGGWATPRFLTWSGSSNHYQRLTLDYEQLEAKDEQVQFENQQLGAEAQQLHQEIEVLRRDLARSHESLRQATARMNRNVLSVNDQRRVISENEAMRRKLEALTKEYESLKRDALRVPSTEKCTEWDTEAWNLRRDREVLLDRVDELIEESGLPSRLTKEERQANRERAEVIRSEAQQLQQRIDALDQQLDACPALTTPQSTEAGRGD